MKKAAFLLVFLFLFSLTAYAGGQSEGCLKIANKLYVLQNKIVDKSFRNLKKGAWALYSTESGDKTKAVYWGLQKSPKTRKKYYMIEFQGKPAGQVWYKLTPKDVKYGAKTYRFWTLEPMEIYAKISGSLVYISKQMIELFMQMVGGRWSTILKEGVIVSPPDCSKLPKITVTIVNLPGHKGVKATIIESRGNGAKLFCSPDVPFGFIKAVTKHERGSPHLVDFAFLGGSRLISEAEAAHAKPIQAPNLPGGLKINGITIQIRPAK